MAGCHRGRGNWRFAAVLVLLIGSQRGLNAQAVAPVPAVPEAAAPCLSCHGSFGRPENLDFPIIGGQNAAYLATALRAYRAGHRMSEAAAVMAPFAQDLDDRTIDDLAAFFAALRSLR